MANQNNKGIRSTSWASTNDDRQLIKRLQSKLIADVDTNLTTTMLIRTGLRCLADQNYDRQVEYLMGEQNEDQLARAA